MRDKESGGGSGRSTKLAALFNSDSKLESVTVSKGISNHAGASPGEYYSDRGGAAEGTSSPYAMSPWNNPATASPYVKSPWTFRSPAYQYLSEDPSTGLVGSLVREEGHVYSLAAAGDLLYTGSDSKNIRVWKGRKEFAGFKSNSGLVKAIVVVGGRVFTGHQDGKIRVWKVSPKDPTNYKRVGSLPSLRDYLKSSINPNSYVKVRRHRNAVWLRHFDAVSCLSLDEEHGLLYSGSWDKTFKVWRISDSRCLESVTAHDDAINAVAVAPRGLFFTGSADGTVKMWRREVSETKGAGTSHLLIQTLLRQESAVTALAVSPGGDVVYAGSSDGLVNCWVLSGPRIEHSGKLRGHRLAVLCVAVAGGLVVSGSADKTVCVWLRDKGGAHERIAVLAAHRGPVKCLAVEEDREPADGRDHGGGKSRWVVYSGSLDRSVNVWSVSEEGQHEAITPSPSPAHLTSKRKGSAMEGRRLG